MNENVMDHPFLVNEEDADTEDTDSSNMILRAGYLAGLALTFEVGSDQRKMLQRSARSLVKAALWLKSVLPKSP